MIMTIFKNNPSIKPLLNALIVGLLCVSTAATGDDRRYHHDDDRFDQCADGRSVGTNAPPVTLNLKDISRRQFELIKIGSYLVNSSGNCNSCHTSAVAPAPYTATGNPFNGQPEVIDPNKYLVGGRLFGAAPNQVKADSLRPDAATGKLELTLEQFMTVMKTGKDPKGKITQVMPWPSYKNLTDCDLKAIYAYLSALPVQPAP